MQGSLHRAWGVAGPSADGRFSGDGDEEDQEDGACLEMAGEAGGAAGVGAAGLLSPPAVLFAISDIWLSALDVY